MQAPHLDQGTAILHENFGTAAATLLLNLSMGVMHGHHLPVQHSLRPYAPSRQQAATSMAQQLYKLPTGVAQMVHTTPHTRLLVNCTQQPGHWGAGNRRNVSSLGSSHTMCRSAASGSNKHATQHHGKASALSCHTTREHLPKLQTNVCCSACTGTTHQLPACTRPKVRESPAHTRGHCVEVKALGSHLSLPNLRTPCTPHHC